MADQSRQGSPFLWPWIAARAFSEAAIGVAAAWTVPAGAPEPASSETRFASPNAVALELAGLRLRVFGDPVAGQTPTLLVAPFALHDSSIADFAPGHSLIAGLLRGGLPSVHLVDWKSASDDMRYFDIDAYLAELNVIVDELGGRVRLAGLCQGGWLSLIYAARFPAKVERLVLAGAPVDLDAAESAMTLAVRNAPPGTFESLVAMGGGRAMGGQLLKLWATGAKMEALSLEALQVERPDARLAQDFCDWYCRTVDLPGHYYLQAVDLLFRHNKLAKGAFIALGRTIDLKRADMPLYILAGDADQTCTLPQVLAAGRLAGATDVTQEVAPAAHLGLFMGRRTVAESWPRIGRWLAGKAPRARNRAKTS